jgi:hypothetical protein
VNAIAFSWCCARNGSQSGNLNLFAGGVAPGVGIDWFQAVIQSADLSVRSSVNNINTIKLGVEGER